MVLFINNTVYVFDANVFINMQRHHPIDVFKTLWLQITELIETGIIISSEEVYDELNAGNDSLISWAKKHKSYFYPSDIEVQKTVREILHNYPDLLTGSKKANGADPFVISLAKTKSCVLVSDETRAGNGQPVKIPNVCEQYGVRIIKFVEFLREAKICV